MSESEFEQKLERELRMMDERCIFSRAFWFLMGVTTYPLAEAAYDFGYNLFLNSLI